MDSIDYAGIKRFISFNFAGDQKATIIQAMRHWENMTCLSFVERTTEKDYIYFHKGRCG